jgi:hypothetical protein
VNKNCLPCITTIALFASRTALKLRSSGGVMNRSKAILFSLFVFASVLSLSSCGSGTHTTLPISVQMSPTASLALDVNQSAPVTATAINAPTNQGFDWALSCGGGNCGTITVHTTSGAPATFTAPAAPLSIAVTITAKLTGLTNSGTATVTVSAPPTVATTSPIAAASLGTPYSLQLAANGGAGAITWALSGGTSLPDTLALSPTGMISGTPTGTTGSFNFKVHVTDSGSPQLTSSDVQLSLTVGAPPISVSLSETSAFVVLNGLKNFIATVLYDPQNGNVDWTLSLNGMPCTITVCGSISPATTASGAPTTYTAPASAPSANITLTATTVDGTPPATSSASITVSAHGFTATGSMGTERVGHTATVLSTGKILVVGGNDSKAQALVSGEMFDPISGTFTAAKSMGTPRVWHTATLLKSGQVLVTGGMQTNSQALASAELFDPTTGMFTSTKGNLVDARLSHTATLLNDGRVLLTGGVGSSGDSIITAELFDPTTGTFAPTGNMEAARAGQTSTLLKSGQVLVTGGRNNAGSFATAEIFDPTKGSFAPTAGSMGTARSGQTATLLGDGTVLVTGGFAGVDALATAELFDPNIGTFTPTTGSMANARGDHTSTLLKDGTVLIVGGAENLQKFNGKPVPTSLGSAELYDPASKKFSNTGGLAGGLGFNGSRFFHTASLLNDGTVLVTGGVQQSVGRGQISSIVLSTAELYQ